MHCNYFSDYGISFGVDNVPELWDQQTLELPQRFEVLSETDLYELCDHTVLACEFSKKHLAVLTRTDLFLFDSLTLKLLQIFKPDQNQELLQVSDLERRQSLEQQIRSNAQSIAFDETGDYVCFPSQLGILCLNLRKKLVTRVLGKPETLRFMQVSLYWAKQMRVQNSASASVHDKSSAKTKSDPTLVCNAFKESRFYLFTRREPGFGAERDYINERIAQPVQA